MKRALPRLTILLALAAAAGPCAAQELGRLFFTPEQRAALDARRRARVPDKPAAVVVASPTTRLDGYVKRSGGPSTVWVNGEPLPEGPGQAPRIESGRSSQGRVAVTVGDSGARVGLKPGEVLDLGSGEVRDLIGGGGIEVRRPGRQALDH
jgi:hypothetical protein